MFLNIIDKFQLYLTYIHDSTCFIPFFNYLVIQSVFLKGLICTTQFEILMYKYKRCIPRTQSLSKILGTPVSRVEDQVFESVFMSDDRNTPPRKDKEGDTKGTGLCVTG